jgi:small subunit ribosomal protein S27e
MARNFVRVKCSECGNEQTTFSRASTEVECLVCGEVLAKPTGGKAEFPGEVVRELAVE